MLSLLNHSKLDRDHKKKYLSLSDTTLKWLNDITDKELWPKLLAGGHLEMHWENVADYYCFFAQEDGSLPEPLIGYIEQSGGTFNCGLNDLSQRIGKDKANVLLKDLLACTSLSPDCYRTMWRSINVLYKSLPVNDLPDEYIEALISTRTVSMTVNNISVVRTGYPDHMTSFVLRDVETFVKLASDKSITLEGGELAALFLTGKLSVRQEERLLASFDGTVPVAGKSYHPKTTLKILAAHFDPKEAEWFLLNYNKLDKQVADAFISWGQSDTASLAKAAEQGELIPEDVYIACLGVFTVEQAWSLKQYLPNKNYHYVCKFIARPRFPDKESTRSILVYFQTQGWISSWKELPNGQLQAFANYKETHIAVVG